MIVVLDVDTIPHDPEPAASVTLAPLTLEDVGAVAGAPDLTPESARKRLQRGDLGAAAWIDGAVAAHQWLAAGPWHMHDVGLSMDLQRDEAVSYDMVTAPEHRRRGLMHSLFVVMGTMARRRGIRRIYGRARLTNAASLATIKRVGFKRLARVDIIRIAMVVNVCSLRAVDGHAAFADRIQRDLRLGRSGIMVLHAPGRLSVRLKPWRLRPTTGVA